MPCHATGRWFVSLFDRWARQPLAGVRAFGELDVDVRAGPHEPDRDRGAGDPSPDFLQHVRDALRHLHDRPRLQTHPLARYVSTDDSKRSSGRGKTLQDSLLAAVEAMRPAADARSDGLVGRGYQL